MFVQANSFTNANRGVGDIERIVVHTAETQETRDSAENVAAFFARASTRVSAHACVDNNTVVECVSEQDIAHHAAGDNSETIGYELSGFAKQTAAEWRDEYSMAMLSRFARYIAPRCVKYNIPPRWLSPEQERRRAKGFVTHKIVSDVFGEGIRSDPGANFPYELFMQMVKSEMAKLEPAPRPTQSSEWRVVVNGLIAHREVNRLGQTSTAYDRTVKWLNSREGERAMKAAVKAGHRPELVFKP